MLPIVKLYIKLRSLNDDLSLCVIGGGGEVEQRVYKGMPGYRQICAGKMHRVFTWRNLIEFLKFFTGLIQSLMIFLSFRPSVIFSKGGFVSLPIVFWAKVFKTKYYIHESDIEIGFANKFAAGSAEKVFTGFPSHFYQSYPWKDKVLFVGQLIEKSEASDYDFGFQDKKPVILVTGGSQGSKVINDTVFGALKEILKSYNLIHQTGTRSYEEAVRVKNSLTLSEKSSYFIQSFLDQKIMEKAISVASLIVTRCGLNTLAEIAVAKKPIIMIPYKHSSSDHQVKNAQEINRITGFPIIKDDDLAPEKLMEKIREMAKNDARIQKMISKYSEIFPENGLKIVAEELMKEEL